MMQLCSRCHRREATRALISGRRKTFFCDVCEPVQLADFRRLVRLDDPIFAQPAAKVVRDPRDVEQIAELERQLGESRRLEAAGRKRLAELEDTLASAVRARKSAEERYVTIERQLADGAREYDRLRIETTKRVDAMQAVIDEKSRQLRDAEINASEWQATAEGIQRELDATLEKLGRAVKARDDAEAQAGQLRRQVQNGERRAPTPVSPSVPALADAPSRRRLTDLVSSTLPLRGVRPLIVPPEMDLLYGVLPADNRSKIAQAVRDYLCGRRSPTKTRGLDDSGRQLFSLRAGKFEMMLAFDDQEGFTIHDLATVPR